MLTDHDQQLRTIPEAVAELDMSESAVRREIRAGRLKATVRRKRYRIPPDAIADYRRQYQMQDPNLLTVADIRWLLGTGTTYAEAWGFVHSEMVEGTEWFKGKGGRILVRRDAFESRVQMFSGAVPA